MCFFILLESASDFKFCQRSDEKFNECLKDAIKNALITLRDGNEAIGIPAIDPYYVEYERAVHVPEGSSPGNFNLRSEVRNATLAGMTDDLEVRRVATKFTDKTFQMKIEAFVPQFKLEGKYKLKGQMLILRMNGDGRMRVTQKNVTGIMSLKGDIVKKEDGLEYINLTSMTLKTTPTTTAYLMENVFNGDEQLSKTINEFMNQHWREVNEMLLPAYFKHFNEKFRQMSNKIFYNVPMDMIFPK